MNTQRALSDQLSILSFHRNFFAKCKEVTDKESIRAENLRHHAPVKWTYNGETVHLERTPGDM